MSVLLKEQNVRQKCGNKEGNGKVLMQNMKISFRDNLGHYKLKQQSHDFMKNVKNNYIKGINLDYNDCRIQTK
jgi:hypothetical protein